jgi:hypothetical protein
LQEKKVVSSAVDSIKRVVAAKSAVASSLDASELKANVNRLSKPGSPASAMKKAGLALIVATPDPVTAVPGVALIAASYASKKNDPAKLDDLAVEAKKIFRDVQSLSL